MTAAAVRCDDNDVDREQRDDDAWGTVAEDDVSVWNEDDEDDEEAEEGATADDDAAAVRSKPSASKPSSSPSSQPSSPSAARRPANASRSRSRRSSAPSSVRMPSSRHAPSVARGRSSDDSDDCDDDGEALSAAAAVAPPPPPSSTAVARRARTTHAPGPDARSVASTKSGAKSSAGANRRVGRSHTFLVQAPHTFRRRHAVSSLTHLGRWRAAAADVVPVRAVDDERRAGPQRGGGEVECHAQRLAPLTAGRSAAQTPRIMIMRRDDRSHESTCRQRVHLFPLLTFIAPSSHLHLIFISPSSHLHLTFIAPSSHLHLTFISPSSHLHLTFISPSSHLHLTFIAPSPHLHLTFIPPRTDPPSVAPRPALFRAPTIFQLFDDPSLVYIYI